MNQIINTPNTMKKYLFFKIELITSIVIILSSLIYAFYLIYQENRRNKISDLILSPYSISKLYASIELEYDTKNQISPYVMGTLEIPSLEIILPVISEMSDDLLKLSICRFYGPSRIAIRKHLYRRA